MSFGIRDIRGGQFNVTMRSLIPLGDLQAHLTTMNIGCIRCDRRASFSVAALIARYGPQKPVADLMAELAEGCGQQNAHALLERCDVRSLDLLKLVEP